MRNGRGVGNAHNSSQIAGLLAPVNGIREEQQRRGQQPRDFMRENRRELVERQKENQASLRKLEEDFATKQQLETRKASKYNSVSSKVKSMMTSPSPRPGSASGSSPGGSSDGSQREGEVAFLRKNTREQREEIAASQRKEEWERKKEEMIRHQDWLDRQDRERKPAVPKASELQHKTEAPTENFVRRNAREAASKPATPIGAAPRREQAVARRGTGKASSALHQAGEIPEYLVKRKQEFAEKEAERRLQEERAKIPVGMSILPEDQRVETLQGLRQQLFDVDQQINRLPIANDSLRVRKRRDELLQEQQEIEQAIKMFSQKIVYVMDD